MNIPSLKYRHKNIFIKKGLFRDSIELLKISEEIKNVSGVNEAIAAMCTDTNKELIKSLNLATDEELAQCTPNDLVVAIGASSQEALDAATKAAQELIERGLGARGGFEFDDVDTALANLSGANIALISIPGQHVRDIAFRLLDRGLNLHIFSDNVPIEDEIEIKRHAADKGLLVLGPGAGTVIIRGYGLAFANKVKFGDVGIAAAAGTGLQEVSSLLSEVGLGVSYGLGVGGNDVKDAVGGVMMTKVLEFLEKDQSTNIILLISKVPHENTMNKIINYINNYTKKPIVINFLGGTRPSSLREGAAFAKTLHQAFLLTVKIKSEDIYNNIKNKYNISFKYLLNIIDKIKNNLSRGQSYIRGLLTGGSFVDESLIILGEMVDGLYSNAPIRFVNALENPFISVKNTVVDLGEEVFTRGRAHPMIDPTMRIHRVLQEARDPSVAVILMDFVLGYGSHGDPAGAHLQAIKEAMEIAESEGRKLYFIAHVCGTREDPQNLAEQEAKLKSVGVITMPTNALAAFLAGLTVAPDPEKAEKAYNELIAI